MTECSPQQTADWVGAGMLANDRASQALGMQVLEIAPGTALLKMAVRGHRLCCAPAAPHAPVP